MGSGSVRSSRGVAQAASVGPAICQGQGRHGELRLLTFAAHGAKPVPGKPPPIPPSQPSRLGGCVFVPGDWARRGVASGFNVKTPPLPLPPLFPCKPSSQDLLHLLPSSAGSAFLSLQFAPPPLEVPTGIFA